MEILRNKFYIKTKREKDFLKDWIKKSVLLIFFLSIFLIPSMFFSQNQEKSNEQKTNSNTQQTQNGNTPEKKFQPEKSPYLSYNIYNELNLVKDVKYPIHITKSLRAELAEDKYWKGNDYDKLTIYFSQAYKDEGINWETVEKLHGIVALEGRVTREHQKKYIRQTMEDAIPAPVNDAFTVYEKAKKMEITDTVFAGIKWPEHKNGRELFKLTEKAYISFNEYLDKFIHYSHYRVGGAKLDLRAGQNVIAPPAAIVFDFERGPFLAAAPWRLDIKSEKAWADRKYAYLKVGPLYLEFDEWLTYLRISKLKSYEEYFANGMGLDVIVKPDSYRIRACDYMKDYYSSLYPKVRKAYEDMKFVRIFSIQMFKDNPSIRAYAVMVPPGFNAAVRDPKKEEVPGYSYVKDTMAELDKISGKQPNIKEVAIQEEGRNPDEYGDWKIEGGIAGAGTYDGGLFIVYPTKADGTEWTAELVGPSITQITRGGIGGVFPYTWLEDNYGYVYDGQIYYDQDAPTHWKAIMDGNPELILEDYRNALSRNHFEFSYSGFYEFKKNEKGDIWLSRIIKDQAWYPVEVEKEMKEIIK